MGSMIHLAVGRLEIDWGKNHSYQDHSPLFQPSDLTKVPYYYVDINADTHLNEKGEDGYSLLTEYKDGMSKPLREVVDRINLLGYTMDTCRKEFTFLSKIHDIDPDKFSFEDLESSLAEIDVEQISGDYGEGEDFGKFFRRYLAPRLGLEEHIRSPEGDFNVSYAMENLSAYTILQLLAKNPRARSTAVTWQFADIEEGGWAKREDILRTLDPRNRFLVVTEGSSDIRIIKQALKILRPHIADFFDFVDMEEGYPFGGAGNLYRFIQGLISISIQNDTVVLYDNDTEGVLNYERSCKLNIPDNMRVLKLPDEERFVQFPTIGPGGQYCADINGRAASIECYLSFGENPLVRWTSYNAKTETYQGELAGKTAVMKTFLEQRERDVRYDYSRIEGVLDLLIGACVGMRERTVAEQYES